MMKKNGKQVLFLGGIFIIAFAIWTALIQMVDVQPLGQNATNIGFATFNCWFHRLTNVNMTIYTITDWMEASYPSSTTLLVLSVMPALIEQIQCRLSGITAKRIIKIVAIAFSAFMVIGDWFPEYIGSRIS